MKKLTLGLAIAGAAALAAPTAAHASGRLVTPGPVWTSPTPPPPPIRIIRW